MGGSERSDLQALVCSMRFFPFSMILCVLYTRVCALCPCVYRVLTFPQTP